MGGPPGLPHGGADPESPVPVPPTDPRRRPDRDGAEGPLPVRRRQDPRDVRALEGPRFGLADGWHPGRPVLSDDGGGEPSPHGGGIAPVGPEDGPPERDVRSCARSRSGPNRAAPHPRDRCEDGAGIRRRDPPDRKSTRLNSSHPSISYAVFCLKKKNPPTHYRDQRPRHSIQPAAGHALPG